MLFPLRKQSAGICIWQDKMIDRSMFSFQSVISVRDIHGQCNQDLDEQ